MKLLVVGEIEEAAEDAARVAIERRISLLKSDTEDGSSRVVADSGQRSKLIINLGNFSFVPTHELARRSS